ncbi:TetR/AcrR family transcriptional regulator [Conyzicola nivalis]|uniref:HTH-type transcriptional regulator PksA n=1 Tax=Conyzicola nivalis TaxID=1477021 RepID=A0A916WKP5_9MICO|nr:TetR/AcrR family transcriptional regulator [Conyzicola nivalis]GGB06844.1 HTH-type transcriptional regulator PksA [Conyzicola nivalis]
MANEEARLPREVTHRQRRRQIAEAVWRLAARGGLEDVTLRQVAQEAGVSARLLQHYFGTRHGLLLGSLQLLNEDAQLRARERVEALGSDLSLRETVRAVLLELLPLDDERRALHLMYAVYFVRFLTDAEMRELASGGGDGVKDLVEQLLVGAHAAGEISDLPRPDLDAAVLVASAEGLQGQMLLGQITAEAAIALIDHQLDGLFAVG